MRKSSLMAAAAILVGFYLAGCATADQTPSRGGSSSFLELRTTGEVSLPAEIRSPFDVRWLSSDVIAVAAGRDGVFAVDIEDGRARRLTPAYPDSGLSALLKIGASKDILAFAGMVNVSWIPNASRKGPGESPVLDFNSISDIEVHDSLIGVLGPYWSPEEAKRRVPPNDGGIVWIIDTDNPRHERIPVYFETSPDEYPLLARCATVEPGALEFLSDGSLIVFPGIEDTVLHFDRDRKLVRTWDVRSLGIMFDCSNSPEWSGQINSDLESRWAFEASQLKVDEMVVIGSDPALLIRSVTENTTSWDLAVLKTDGRVEVVDLPASLPTRMGYARADVRGKRMVLLMTEHFLPSETRTVAPRILILEVE